MEKTFRLGIIGHPVGHSLSPVMHTTAAQITGINLEYDPYDVPPINLGRFVRNIRETGIDGLNVTVPHKVAVMDHLDEITVEAERIGAVNTILREGSRLLGANTDGYGFVTSLVENAKVNPAGKKIFIYGAGGAARAICAALGVMDGVEAVIANRTVGKAEELAARMTAAGASATALGYNANNLVDSVNTADIIVNTTSVGMKGFASDALPALEGIRQGQLVVDIVYRPLVTPLLRRAAVAGADTLDGLWMLIHQGAKSFELWTEREFPANPVRERLLRELGETI